MLLVVFVFLVMLMLLAAGAGLVLVGNGGLQLHADGVADVVGILAHERLETVGLQELGIVLTLRVLLDGQHDLGADLVLFAGRYGVAVLAGGFPQVGPARLGLGVDLDVAADHEGGVEAHAELTDDVRVGGVLVRLGKGAGAALGDDAKVVLQLLAIHAAAVVADGQGARLLVRFDADEKFTAIQPAAALLVEIIALVYGVAGVGDQFAQKDLLVGIDGVHHQIQQPFRFRFKLFFSHASTSIKKKV